MKLVVGLGNPGQKYRGTRHNVGFDVIAKLAQRYDTGRPKSKFNAEVVETVIENEKVVIASPLTFMNLSGQSVRAAFDFYKLELADLIIICDDLALDVGRLRIKPGGSAGGQNGLKDIIQRLGSSDFTRLRVGIGKTPSGWETADYVLGKFTEQEKPEIENAISRAVKVTEAWMTGGTQLAMNQFNADPNKKPKSKKSKLDRQPREQQTKPRLSDSDSTVQLDQNDEN